MKPLLAIALCCLLPFPLCGQTSRALVVAVGDYPAGSGWNGIHAGNDLLLVLPMLARNGFRTVDIACLSGAEATKAAVVGELERLGRKTRAGDCIYIHFSCHGQLMADDNGDEPDGYDEALIPYDAPRRYSKGVYEGGRHLRDDELRLYLDGIRRRAGPAGNVVAVFDACHSGSADRDGNDDEYVRGTTYVFAPEGYDPPEIDPEKVVWRMSAGAELAPLTVLSACRPDELNYEYKAPDGNYYGMLTYALCAGAEVRAKITVAGFFGLLKARVARLSEGRRRAQTPDLQSTHEDKTFRIGR